MKHLKSRYFSIFSGIICTFLTLPVVEAQTVQLPSFQHFDSSTTVLVPDGGSINTGGISRSSAGGTRTKTPILPFGNRSYGASTSGSFTQTSVQIIDMHEMDEQILNSPSSAGSSYSRSRGLAPADNFQNRVIGHAEAQNAPGAFLSVRDYIASQIEPEDESARQEEIQASVRRERLDLSPLSEKSVQQSDTSVRGEGTLNAPLTLAPSARKDSSKSVRKAGKPSKRVKKSNSKVTEKADSAKASESSQALLLAKKGLEAEKTGKYNLAVSYYQQAESLASGSLLQKIQKRRNRLEDTSQAEK